ncbi:hypothetical protein [Amycolatopsis plumensis]|uniref:Transmembrane protein n=1 Tax=Amycolatopsis plumensis TaxID=236508 RepID=A0ABV5U8K9_9PSEU
MSNQTQVQVQNSAVPQTIHIWMFATAVVSTVFVIPHAILAFEWQWPPTLANLHMLITLGFWIAGVVFLTRRPSGATEIVARPLSPKQQLAMSEIDRLNALLDLNDE